jgi:hypothetical protein
MTPDDSSADSPKPNEELIPEEPVTEVSPENPATEAVVIEEAVASTEQAEPAPLNITPPTIPETPEPLPQDTVPNTPAESIVPPQET